MAAQRKNDPGHGIEFEILVPAFFALKLNNDKNVDDFTIQSNVSKNFGEKLDDVIIDIKMKNNTSTLHFAFQLKQKEAISKKIYPGSVEGPKGNFSLKKYCQDFKKNVSDDNKNKYHFILYTNAHFDNNQTKEVNNFDMMQTSQCPGYNFFDSSLDPRNVYAFSVNDKTPIEDDVSREDYQNFLNKFTLYVCQKNFEALRENIREILKDSDTLLKYESLFRKWHQGKFTNKVIDRATLNVHLIDIFISKEIMIDCHLFNSQSNAIDVMRKIVRSFDVIVIDNSKEDFLKHLTPCQCPQKFPLDNDIRKHLETYANLDKINVQLNDPDAAMKKCMFRLGQQYKFIDRSAQDLDKDLALKIFFYFFERRVVLHCTKNAENLIWQMMQLYQTKQNDIKFVLLADEVNITKPSNFGVFQSLKDLEKDESLYRDIIQSCTVCVKGRSQVTLEQLIVSFDEISSLIGLKELFQMLGNKSQVSADPTSCYIPRRVSLKRFDTKTVLNFAKDADNVVVINFCGRFESVRDQIQKKKIEVKKIDHYDDDAKNPSIFSTEDESVFRRGIKITSQNPNERVFFLKMVDEDSFTLVKTTKQGFDLINNNKLTFRKIVNEGNIHSCINDPVNILVAEPGMGKSTMMKYLRSSCPWEFWTLTVDLKDHNLFLKDKHTSDEIFARFVESEDSNDDVFLTKIEKLFRKKKKVVIFLDGLDELDGCCVDNVLNYIQEVSSMGFRVWVSSRQNLTEKLEEKFCIFSVNIVELIEEEQKSYVKNRLGKKYTEDQVQQLLDEIFSSTDIINNRQILGVPLQLYIITQIFLDDKSYFQRVEKNMFVLTILYGIFFRGRYQHSFKKFPDEKSRLVANEMEDYLEKYEIAALETLFDDAVIAKLQLDFRKNRRFLENIKQEKDILGIVAKVNDEGKAVFEHYTFAEYFACVFISHNFEKAKILKKELFSDKYKNLLMILNIMMAEDNPLHLAVIYKSIDQIEKQLKVKHDIYDKGRRNPLHIATTVIDPRYISQDYYLSFIRQDQKASDEQKEKAEKEIAIFLLLINFSPYEKDALFESTAFHYAILKINLFAIEGMLNSHGMSHDAFGDLKKYNFVKNANIAEDALFWGYPNLLSVTLHQKHAGFERYSYIWDFLSITCSPSVKLQLANVLIDYGVPITDTTHVLDNIVATNDICLLNLLLDKTPNNETMTQNRSTGMINFPRYRKFNINIRNFKGQSILHMAVENGQLDMMKLFIEQKGDISATDLLKETALHYAARAGNVEIASSLLNKRIYVNCQNIRGETALLVAAKNQHFRAVKLLVLRGADVNCISYEKDTIWGYLNWYHDKSLTDLIVSKANLGLQNRYNKSPLDYAIENEDVDAVQSLLQDKNDVRLSTETWIEAILTQNTALQKILEQKCRPCSEQIKKDAFDGLQNRRMKQLDSYWNSMCEDDKYSSLSATFTKQYYYDNKYKKLHLAVYGGDKTRTEGIIKVGIDLEDVDIYNPIYPLHFAVKNGVLQSELLKKMAADIDQIYTEERIWKLKDMRRHILQRYPLDQKAMQKPKKHKYIYLTKEFD